MSDAQQTPPRTRVVFRYDDCSAVSSLDLERGLAGAFGDARGQLTLGVIPRVCAGSFRDPHPQEELPLPRPKVEFLRAAAAAGHVEVALHGWNHQVAQAGRLGEFVGLSPSEQRRRILAGRRELSDLTGSEVTTFIPPWNAYDADTVAVLEEAKFTCLSASLRGPFPATSTVTFLPFSCWLNDVRLAVAALARVRRVESVLVVILHDFDFFESGKAEACIDVEGLRAILTDLANDPNVQISSLRQAVTAHAAIPPQEYVAYGRWRRRFEKLPWRYRHLLENQAFSITEPGRGNTATLLARQAHLSLSIAAQDLVPAFWKKITRRFRRTARAAA